MISIDTVRSVIIFLIIFFLAVLVISVYYQWKKTRAPAPVGPAPAGVAPPPPSWRDRTMLYGKTKYAQLTGSGWTILKLVIYIVLIVLLLYTVGFIDWPNKVYDSAELNKRSSDGIIQLDGSSGVSRLSIDIIPSQFNFGDTMSVNFGSYELKFRFGECGEVIGAPYDAVCYHANWYYQGIPSSSGPTELFNVDDSKLKLDIIRYPLFGTHVFLNDDRITSIKTESGYESFGSEESSILITTSCSNCIKKIRRNYGFLQRIIRFPQAMFNIG